MPISDYGLEQQVADYGWIAEGVTREGRIALATIRDIAKLDVEMAKLMSLQPWLADGVTAYELSGMISVRIISKSDLELAKLILRQPFMDQPFRQRDAFALQGLRDLVTYSPGRNVMPVVAAQPWFNDGIDDLETALLKVIGNLIDDDFRRALIKTHYIKSVPVKLPLTGDVELIVVRHTPFPPDDDIVSRNGGGCKGY